MDGQAMKQATAALRDPNKNVRLEAIRELGGSGDPRAIDPLLAPLKDSDEELGMAAAEALARIGTPAVEPLIATMRRKKVRIRHPEAEAVGCLVQILLSLLSGRYRSYSTYSTETVDVIPRTVHGLSLIGAPAVEPLISLLREKDIDIRRAATELLVTIGTAAVNPLIAALGDKDKEMRRAVAYCLGRISDLRAFDPLIAALGDKEPQVRRSAALALGSIGDPRAIDFLTPSQRDKDKDVRRAATMVLSSLGDLRAVDSIIEALGEASEIAVAAIDDLLTIGATAVEPVITALRHPNKDVRRRAAYILGAIGDSRARDPLADALRDKEEIVRNAAKNALEKMGYPVKTS